MEHTPFSEAGLEPSNLEKESALVERSVHAVQEAIKEIDFVMIDNIMVDILSGAYTTPVREKIKEHYALESRYPIAVTYSGEINTGEVFTQGKYAPAAYSQFPNIVVHAREIVDEKGNLSKEDKLYLLKVLTHEIAHHLSFGLEDQDHADIPRVYSGVAFGEPDKDGYVLDTSFSLLNEAITEVISDAVCSEYLARSGRIKDYEERRKWYQRPSRISRYATYLSERMSLMSFVDKLAKYSNIPEGKIYQALTVEYFTNADISRAEIFNEMKDEAEIKDVILNMKEDKADEFTNLPENKQIEILSFLDQKQMEPVKAFFGRDYIGETNQNRHVEKKFYNVLR